MTGVCFLLSFFTAKAENVLPPAFKFFAVVYFYVIMSFSMYFFVS